ncbi:unnamed protein product [Cuscuta epithymum]|nr:unnamed protein product [Cuscuta epithymum]
MPKRRRKESKKSPEKELVAEDWCFTCKDGGELLLCDNRQCVKAYHPECVGKEYSALTSNQRWMCDWHFCLICGRSSILHCYCCPNAVCRKCFKHAKFVRVKDKRGFCNNCLKLAILVEENKDVDSEGESVDLKDRETYEGLFREYYEIIRESEGLGLDTLRAAKIRLDLDKSDLSSSDADEPADVGEDGKDQCILSDDDDDDDEHPYEWGGKKSGQKKKKPESQKASSRKKKKPKKMVFSGWGSDALICFLKSIGEETKQERKPDDVERVILRYVKENKLTHPTKKRKVICDYKLQSLLQKKEINKNRIPKLIECHFALNEEESEDGDIFNVDGDEKNTPTSDLETENQSDNDDALKKEGLVASILQSKYAAIIPENIKLVYLKKSLVHELCKQPDAFEEKVIGCFVRFKSNPNGFHRRNLYQLEQVTGIRSASLGEEKSDIMLSVSNMPNDICLSMLSDADFSEEECGELLNKVKAGLISKPVLVELQEKASSLHKDITKHWLPREINRLQNLINLANEKGWRRELYEYLERKQKLENPKEVSRLLEILPVVIPDSGDLDSPSEEYEETNIGKKVAPSQKLTPSVVTTGLPVFMTSEEKEHNRTEQPLQIPANQELNKLNPCQHKKELKKHINDLPSMDHLLPSHGNEKPNQQTDDDVNLETIKPHMCAMADVIKPGDEKPQVCDGEENDQHMNIVTQVNEAIHKDDMITDEKAEVVGSEDREELERRRDS